MSRTIPSRTPLRLAPARRGAPLPRWTLRQGRYRVHCAESADELEAALRPRFGAIDSSPLLDVRAVDPRNRRKLRD